MWIEYDAACLHIGLFLPEGWAYEVLEMPETAPGEGEFEQWGFILWPEIAPEVKIRLMGQNQPLSLCGFGMKQEKITCADGKTATCFVLDDTETRGMWVVFDDEPGEYVLEAAMRSADWAVYGETIMAMLESAELGGAAIGRTEAVELVRAVCPIPGATLESFDFRAGVWTIRVENTAASRTYQVGADGALIEVSESS